MKFFKQLSKYALELFLGVSGLWIVVQKFTKLTESTGLAMFLGGIVFAVYKIRSSLDQITNDTTGMQLKLRDVAQDVEVLQGESYLRQLAEAAQSTNEREQPHIYAGHGITRRVYDHGATLIKGFRQLQRREANEFRLEEKYIINDFLTMLAEALPAPSVWLGVTHLTVGWADQDADPGFVEFRRAIRRRSRAGEIKVLRIYCVGDDGPDKALSEHLQEEAINGVSIVTVNAKDAPSDMSLIYSVPDGIPILDRANEPTESLKKSVPICGLEFRTRSGRSIDSVFFYTPSSDNFRTLAHEFDRAWLKGQTFTPA